MSRKQAKSKRALASEAAAKVAAKVPVEKPKKPARKPRKVAAEPERIAVSGTIAAPPATEIAAEPTPPPARASWWDRMVAAIGNALGEAKFDQ